MFSLDDFKFKRIANVSYFVFSINSEDFNRDGREDFLLTGYDPRLDLGKITLLENTSEGFRKAFECAIGNKTFDAFVSDVNKDGYPDFVVLTTLSCQEILQIFVNRYPNFEKRGIIAPWILLGK